MTIVRRTSVTRAELDHIVVAATTLADGVDWIAALTGVAPVAGGRHARMGTHNALLRLGARAYLEVIAIDPAGAKPSRPRWFDLDDVALQAELKERPRLIHWVARTSDIGRAAAACAVPMGAIHAMERGDYRWRITIPDDGRRPGRGVVPTLIQWDVPFHPAERLPPSGVSIVEFAATHPDPAPVRDALAGLGLAEAVRVSYDRECRLAAMLRTPRGTVALAG